MAEQRIQPNDVIRPTSITLVRRDPLPNLVGLGRKERISAFIEAVSLVASQQRSNDKVRLDATTSQRHSRGAIFTQNPVPRGNIVTDHSIERPLIVQFSGVISETPFYPYTGQNAFGGLPGVSRVQDYIRLLDQFFDERQPLYMASSIRTVDGMGITALNISKSQSTGAAIDVSMSLQQILFVSAIRAEPTPDTQAAQLGSERHEVAASSAFDTIPIVEFGGSFRG